MNIVSAIVLYLVLWFLVLFVVLPLRLTTQSEDKAGAVPGTPLSAPANLNIRRKFKLTTLGAAVVWFVIFLIITFNLITMEDLDVVRKFRPGS